MPDDASLSCALCNAVKAAVCCLVTGEKIAVCCRCVIAGLGVLEEEERANPELTPEALPWLVADCMGTPTPALVAAAEALNIDVSRVKKPPWQATRLGANEVWCHLCGAGRRSLRMVAGGSAKKPVSICVRCLVDSAGVMRGGGHPAVIDEVLRDCIATLPPRAPSRQALPLFVAAAALTTDGDQLRELAARGSHFGCFHWAASIYQRLLDSDARRETDLLDQAIVLTGTDERVRVRTLLDSIVTERLLPVDRLRLIHERVHAAVEAQTASARDLAGFSAELEQLAAIDDETAPKDNASLGMIISTRALLALLEGDATRAEALFASLFKRSSLDEMRLGDMLARGGDDSAASMLFARELAEVHPESWLAAELRKRLQVPTPPPSPNSPYR